MRGAGRWPDLIEPFSGDPLRTKPIEIDSRVPIIEPASASRRRTVTPPLSSLTSNIVSAEQHRAIRIEQTRIHFLGRSQFYQQPVCIKYSIHCWLGKVARLRSVFQRINGGKGQRSVRTRLP